MELICCWGIHSYSLLNKAKIDKDISWKLVAQFCSRELKIENVTALIEPNDRERNIWLFGGQNSGCVDWEAR